MSMGLGGTRYLAQPSTTWTRRLAERAGGDFAASAVRHPPVPRWLPLPKGIAKSIAV